MCWGKQLCYTLLQHLVTNKNTIPRIVSYFCELNHKFIFEISDFNSQKQLSGSDRDHSDTEKQHYTCPFYLKAFTKWQL